MVFHVDALEWVAGRRSWAQFFRFTERLARTPGTAYYSELMLDPELAELRAKMPKAKNPQLLGWTAEMSLLADGIDLLYKRFTGDARASLPRPLTAVDHRSLANRQAAMNRTIARFSPHHVKLTPKLSP